MALGCWGVYDDDDDDALRGPALRPHHRHPRRSAGRSTCCSTLAPRSRLLLDLLLIPLLLLPLISLLLILLYILFLFLLLEI